MSSAAILAGGRATRMAGQDKSSLRVRGRPILDRQLDALSGAVDRVFLVGGHSPRALPRHVSAIPDRVTDHGPLGGLEAALDAAGSDPLLLLACDMPNISHALVVHLLAELVGVDAVVPRTERGYHPLCAAYASSCRPHVQQRLARRQLRMLDLLDDLRVRVVDVGMLMRLGGGDQLLANVNTPADLDALESLRNH
jgi:molybdopterin-guanine dinucleotide biosynthesis protein A